MKPNSPANLVIAYSAIGVYDMFWKDCYLFSERVVYAKDVKFFTDVIHTPINTMLKC